MHVDYGDPGSWATINCVSQGAAIFKFKVFVLEHCACNHSEGGRGVQMECRDGCSALSREFHGEGKGSAQLQERSRSAAADKRRKHIVIRKP
jgi:hypothetical protein